MFNKAIEILELYRKDYQERVRRGEMTVIGEIAPASKDTIRALDEVVFAIRFLKFEQERIGCPQTKYTTGSPD